MQTRIKQNERVFTLFVLMMAFTLILSACSPSSSSMDRSSHGTDSMQQEDQDEMMQEEDQEEAEEVQMEAEDIEEGETEGMMESGDDSDDADVDTGDQAMMERDVATESATEMEIEAIPDTQIAASSYKLNDPQPYDADLAQAAMDDGKTVVFDVYASWCSTCNVNKGPLTDAIKASENEVAAFIIDYDSPETENVRNQLGVTTQSTYLRFNGQQEAERIIGLLNDDKINRLVN